MKLKIKRLKRAGESRLSSPKSSSLSEPPPNDPTRLRLFPYLIKTNLGKRFCSPSLEPEDFLLACRYCYYCRNISLISDFLYDEFEKVWLELHPDSPLSKAGSDKPEDYEPHIRALGLYFAFKFSQRRKPIDDDEEDYPSDRQIAKTVHRFKKKVLIKRRR